MTVTIECYWLAHSYTVSDWKSGTKNTGIWPHKAISTRLVSVLVGISYKSENVILYPYKFVFDVMLLSI